MPRDPHEFTRYVERSELALLRAAYLLLGDRAAAQDLVQDTYERLYVAWPRVDTPDAYARRALVNGATSRWRRLRRRPETAWRNDEAEQLPAAWLDPADGAGDRDVVVRALATLPARMRAVLVLRFLSDLSEAETAELLGCSIGTVKSQSSRGLARLRVLLVDPATQAATGRMP